jgi:hypothetical protein
MNFIRNNSTFPSEKPSQKGTYAPFLHTVCILSGWLVKNPTNALQFFYGTRAGAPIKKN